ncbi:hypothetical protein [uncultured Ruminococcus sp.]|uniref:hypothetical protein n=1 Tax=uncultured Ruminococcus sp. TaxID=165186 RepID=UPI0025ECAE01|nr:hypothetical protein [uncultured Ruminococcus sp.]
MKNCKCMCKFNEEVRSSSTALWLFALCSFLIGIIIGFILSPIKKGIKIGCNNGNNTYEKEQDMLPYYDDDEIKF